MSDVSRRMPAGVSLGCHVPYAAPFHTDMGDMLTTVAGVKKRIFRKPPAPGAGLIPEIKQFTREFLAKNFKPLPADTDVSFETWLSQTDYPGSRRAELIAEKDRILSIMDKTHWKVKCHVKDEFYDDYKNSRGIFSRTDAFKVFSGPFIKVIETEVYKYYSFIKHVPVSERARYISELVCMNGGKYYSTDHTAFESNFVREFMEAVEFELYWYILSLIPEVVFFLNVFQQATTRENHLVFKWFLATVMATRMSGEMNTSLGNGFSNLILILFVCFKRGIREPRVVVEGDDGLFCLAAGSPLLTPADFEYCGFSVKMESFDSISDAGFCGLVFSEFDAQLVRDPVKALIKFGWAPSKYRNVKNKTLMMLLRAKSLSYAYQYPGCPIVAALAHYGLRVTRSIDIRRFVKESRWFDEFERKLLLDAIRDERGVRNSREEPGPNTRLLVFDKFGVCPSLQIAIEHHIDSLNDLVPLDGLLFSTLIPDKNVYNWFNYVCFVDRRSPNYNYPSPWPVSQNFSSFTEFQNFIIAGKSIPMWA